MKKNLIAVCGLFLLVLQPLFAQSTPEHKGAILFELMANNELAQALCYQESPVSFGEVLFKGPSGAKIRVTQTKDENFFGHTIEFVQVPERISFKSSTSTIFYKQNLPVPVIYTVNGVAIAGIADGGAREAELLTSVKREFSALPADFQQGLREFYTFCDRSNPGLLAISAPLSAIFWQGSGNLPGQPGDQHQSSRHPSLPG